MIHTEFVKVDWVPAVQSVLGITDTGFDMTNQTVREELEWCSI